jgi:peptide/nickel transport system substrate-binding protein
MRRGPRSAPGRSRARGAAALAAVIVALLVATGSGLYLLRTREAPVRGGILTEGVVIDAGAGGGAGGFSLLPGFADAPPSRDVAGLLYLGLTRTGPDGRPLPRLASRWEVDASVKTFTFHLRPGLRWSDGAKLTASDAVYTLGVLQGPSLAQTQVGQAWGGVTVAAPDPLTVVYTLPSPSAGFVNLTRLGLLPEHALKPRAAAALRDATDAPTSGPFRVDQVERDRVQLRRNLHSSEPAWLDGIDLRLFNSSAAAVEALLAGDIDSFAGLLPADAIRVGSSLNQRLLRAGSFTYAEILFNQLRPPLADPVVRRAISSAVDRRAQIDGPLHGFARLDGSPIPPTISWAAATEPGAVLDRRAAARSLDTAGWKLPRPGAVRQKDGADLVLALAAEDLEPYNTVARQAVSDLAAVGVKVKLSLLPSQQLVALLQGRRFDMVLTALDNGPDPDIYVLWHSSQSVPGGFNFSGMAKDPFLDKDLEDGRFNYDVKKRRPAYVDAQKIIRQDAAADFLFSPDILVGYSKRVKGLRFDAAMDRGGRYDFVSQWYLESRRIWK